MAWNMTVNQRVPIQHRCPKSGGDEALGRNSTSSLWACVS